MLLFKVAYSPKAWVPEVGAESYKPGTNNPTLLTEQCGFTKLILQCIFLYHP